MFEFFNFCGEIGIETIKELMFVVRDALVLKLTAYGIAGLGLHLIRELF